MWFLSELQSPNNNLIIYYVLQSFGSFRGPSRHPQAHVPQRAFNKVPNRLGFCLKDIVPHCFLQGHMFMGLSACGQFLLSYKVCCNDHVAANHYSFNIGYKYTLYFWIYQPHKPLRSFYKCCLFDDHGVDNLKEVTMSQWKTGNPRVLIIHGAAEDENEDSYITYVKVPKLGCLDCKRLRDADDDGLFRWYALCLKCNLTIHTKYSTIESDRKFIPSTNLICPERILIVANGFMHMLHVQVEQPAASNANVPSQLPAQLLGNQSSILPPAIKATPPHESPSANSLDMLGCDNHNNIIARIIADFSDIETDSTHSNSSSRYGELNSPQTHKQQPTQARLVNSPGQSELVCVSRKTYDELIFTCNGSSSSNNAVSMTASTSSNATSSTTAGTLPNASSEVLVNKAGGLTKVSLINHQGRRHHRIVTKSYRNGVTTVDLQASTSHANSNAGVDKYEFSEDNEKCEKISTLRKRRLADKKYEFSEDNSENIIPFTKTRTSSAGSKLAAFFGSSPASQGLRSLHRSTTMPVSGLHQSPVHYYHNSPGVSPSSSPHPHATVNSNTSPHATSTTIQQGFRSPPCSSNSPVNANAIMRSPSRHSYVTPLPLYSCGNHKAAQTPMLSMATQQMLSYKPLGTLSPLQISMTKRNHLEFGHGSSGMGSMSPNGSSPFLSPRREESTRIVEIPLQPAAGIPEKSLCTKKFKRRYVEEDDAASVITSEEDDCISPGYHTSLPMEVHGSCYADMQMISQASYQQLHCASVVITQHSFDLEAFTYYAISTLCQKNNKTYDVIYDWACELISVCPLSYTIICLLMAQFTARDQLPTSPTNCLNCSRKLDCVFHRRQFECRILFTWNMETGDCSVMDYGELNECRNKDLFSPIKQAFTLAQTAKKLAQEMSNSLEKIQHNTQAGNLRVLDSNLKKSKTSLTDNDNMIEFYLKRPRHTSG